MANRKPDTASSTSSLTGEKGPLSLKNRVRQDDVPGFKDANAAAPEDGACAGLGPVLLPRGLLCGLDAAVGDPLRRVGSGGPERKLDAARRA